MNSWNETCFIRRATTRCPCSHGSGTNRWNPWNNKALGDWLYGPRPVGPLARRSSFHRARANQRPGIEKGQKLRLQTRNTWDAVNGEEVGNCINLQSSNDRSNSTSLVSFIEKWQTIFSSATKTTFRLIVYNRMCIVSQRSIFAELAISCSHTDHWYGSQLVYHSHGWFIHYGISRLLSISVAVQSERQFTLVQAYRSSCGRFILRFTWASHEHCLISLLDLGILLANNGTFL